ncbi:MAG: GGDEF domain-containing protein [Lachnospiraceae bacterium]|nr:GGDEF domain-containing protein [Lachnospiraceae bacterium]
MNGMNKRKNIAILLGDIRDVYSNAVAKGAMKAAKESDCNLLIVPGRYYRARKELLLGEYEYQYQSLFTYFTENNVDVIILCEGAIGIVSDSTDRNSLEIFRERIKDIPFITISGDAPGIPDVRYDNKNGIIRGITHMVRCQHCRKIAMVGGPADNRDTRERVSAYKEALVSLGKEADDDLIIYGEYTERSESLIYAFLKRHPDVDGMVFANDRMAIGGYEAAAKCGRIVGRDISFLGFDNIEKDSYMDPPLASVDADVLELGYYAVKEALRFEASGKVTEKIIPSRFVPRESIMLTGGQELIEQALGYGIDEDTDFELLADNSFEYIYAPQNDEIGKANLYECYRRFLFDLSAVVFSNNVSEERIEVLKYSFRQLFTEDVRGDLDVTRFIIILDAMEQIMLDNHPTDAKRDKIIRMSSYAYKYLSNVISLRENRKNYRLKKIQHEIYRISADLVGFHNVSDTTYASVLSNFTRFGINNCFLFLFENPIRNEYADHFKPDEILYLKAALNNGDLYSPSKREQAVALSDMFSFVFDEIGECTHLIMLNLYIRNMIYGVILCDIPYEIFSFYESFNYQVSSAVRIIRLLEENDEKGRQLKASLDLLMQNNIQLEGISKKDELTGINNRRGFLSDVETMFAESVKMKEEPKYVLVGYADADGLKGVNDTFGHDEGDSLIVACANVLKETVEDRGVIGRMGGDEFAAMLFTSDEQLGEQLKERMESLIDSYNGKSEKPYKLSVSFGTFLFPYASDLKILGLLESADKQMYRIKENHRAGRRRGDFLPNDVN